MNYKNMIKPIKELAIKFDGEVLNVVYDQSKFNLKNSPLRSDPTILYIDFIIDLFVNKGFLISWDLDIDGVPVPIKKDALEELNVDWVKEIYEAMVADIRVAKKK